MSETEEIKSRLDIVDVVSEHVQLRRSGRSYSGFCPFHDNSRTPAFHVFPETQTWYCFGACGEGGDVFNFVMKKEGFEFKEALIQLAARAGVTLTSDQPVARERQAEADRLVGLLAAATDYYHQLLQFAPEADQVRRYLAGRGLTAETIEQFRLGFAPGSWDSLRNHFTAQGYAVGDLVAAGLLSEHPERDAVYDRFRNRLMIPIRDAQGRVIGFGARTLVKDGVPKYLNSPQTLLFDKSRVLFGLDMARRHIRDARQVVIVEGYMDVMQAWQAGFRNVVAQMGTALTEAQLRLLKRFSRRFVLALDADAAGANATLRGLTVAREALAESEITFDARGLVKHEGQLQADIHVVTLPEGKDPDNIIQEQPETWPILLEEARPVVAYVIDVVTRELDLADAKGKVAAAQTVLPLLEDIREPVEKAHYRRLLAQKLEIDERTLDRIPATGSRHRRRQAEPGRRTTELQPRNSGEGVLASIAGGTISTRLRETNYLRCCLADAALVSAVDQKLATVEQPPVAPGDFSHIEDQVLFTVIRESVTEGNIVGQMDLWDSLEGPVQERYQTLAQAVDPAVTERDRLPYKLALSVLDWRLAKVKSSIRAMETLMKEQPAQARREMFDDQQQRWLEFSRHSRSLGRAREAMSTMSRRER